MTPPLIQHLEYNGIKYYGDQILVGKSQKIPKLEVDTNISLQKLVSITGSLPEKAEPLSLKQYITEVNRLQETTSFGTSDITQTIVKPEARDPKLSEIVRRRFNLTYGQATNLGDIERD